MIRANFGGVFVLQATRLTAMILTLIAYLMASSLLFAVATISLVDIGTKARSRAQELSNSVAGTIMDLQGLRGWTRQCLISNLPRDHADPPADQIA